MLPQKINNNSFAWPKLPRRLPDVKSPKTGIPLIDAEIDGTNGSGGCRLGCANCHYSCETLPRSKEGTPLWDALMAKPVKKRV
jgi:deoxyribodipyrimidine photolyase